MAIGSGGLSGGGGRGPTATAWYTPAGPGAAVPASDFAADHTDGMVADKNTARESQGFVRGWGVNARTAPPPSQGLAP